jgi:hypothetical protein
MTGAPNSLERISHRAQRVLAKPVPAQALKDVAAECARAVGEIEHSCRRAR